MAKILRGEIYWTNLDPARGHEQSGERPALVLSHDAFNELPKRSWVKISQIRTLSVERLGKKIGRVTTEELDLIVEGLNEIIGG